MRNYKPLLITLPCNLVADLDRASEAFNWTRMALIRRCIIRDMQYVLQAELPKLSLINSPADHASRVHGMMRPFLRA
jgi:hypothetical protein